MNETWLYIEKTKEIKSGLLALTAAKERLDIHGITFINMTVAGETKGGWWVKYEVISRRISDGNTVHIQEEKKA
jgi:hypothetical protein